MKRILSLAVLVAIVAALTAPAVAFSAPKGGSDKPKGKSAERPAASADRGRGTGTGVIGTEGEEEVPGAPVADKKAEKDAAKEVRADEKDLRKDAKAEEKAQRREEKQERIGAEAESETVDSDEASGSAETSLGAEAPAKVTGVANALAHIQANLARMQEKVDAGLRKGLPAGLVSVVAKFMGWLGLTPSQPGVDGTGTPTETVVPTGTVDASDTVVPTDTVNASDTIVPTETPNASETAAPVL